MREKIKPLRNYLRQFNRLSMMKTIYALSMHLDFGNPLPAHLRAANPYGKKGQLALGFFLWELDTLAREAILHCDPQRGKLVTDWSIPAKAINLLKRTEDQALNLDVSDVFSEVTRIAHRQFHWQQGFAHTDMTRTRMIYRQPGMDEVVQETFGLSAEQVVQGGLALLSTYLKYEAIIPSWTTSATKLLGFDIHRVIDTFATDMPTLRQACLDSQSLDQDWAYTFHPLWLHPLVRLDDAEGRIICPIPGLLARRYTTGLYFDFAKKPDNLSRYLGPSYQAYIGRVLEASNRGNFRILPEERYGKKGSPKDSVDWLVEDDTGVLFVECKLLKMAQVVRTKLAPEQAVLSQLTRLATGIGQTYATLTDALAGNYPHWQPSGKPCYPLIVTMDNWNLFTHTTHDYLRNMVGANMTERGLDLALLETNPYLVCSANELEIAAQVMHAAGIDNVMEGMSIGDKAGWLFSSYLRSEFYAELKAAGSLFPDEAKSVIPKHWSRPVS